MQETVDALACSAWSYKASGSVLLPNPSVGEVGFSQVGHAQGPASIQSLVAGCGPNQEGYGKFEANSSVGQLGLSHLGHARGPGNTAGYGKVVIGPNLVQVGCGNNAGQPSGPVVRLAWRHKQVCGSLSTSLGPTLKILSSIGTLLKSMPVSQITPMVTSATSN